MKQGNYDGMDLLLSYSKDLRIGNRLLLNASTLFNVMEFSKTENFCQCASLLLRNV